MHFNPLRCIAALVAVTAGSRAACVTGTCDQLVDCLQSSLSPEGSVVLADEPLFANDTGRYSELYAPTFRVVSSVANEHDVRASIQCAQWTNTRFFITGRRHGFYKGLEKIKQGLEIYTEAFNKLTIDADENTMTCEGAISFQQAIDALYAVGKEIPTGSGVDVGFVGASLGGGIARLQGLHGLLIDSLLSVRIMLANTTVVEASTEKNPDLFYGIRGAGFNFGFILNATYQIYDQVQDGMHLNADIIVPSNVTGAFYQMLKDEAPLPPPLAFTSGLAMSPMTNETVLAINAVYAGPEDEGRKAIAFLQNLSPIIQQNISYVPWNILINTTAFGTGAGNTAKGTVRRSILGIAFNQIDPEAQVKMTAQFDEMITKFPQTSTSAVALYYPATQAVYAVPDNATSYAWRSALGHMAIEITFSDNTSTDATVDDYGKKFRQTLLDTAGTKGLECYVGFSHGDEPLESIFSREKLPQLAALKKKYDPCGLFNAFHPLPMEYPPPSPS